MRWSRDWRSRMSDLSFRGASEASEPGIHNHQRCGVWIPGLALRAVPE
jgi:hypothetical protein